jgi:sec-independent protein translocase protein TatB
VTFGINGAELIILIILAVLVLGPEKLPEYTRKLTEWIRTLRRMAEGAKVQFKDETGTDFDEIDWRRYDPRQYDPRRIIREALADPVDAPGPDGQGPGTQAGSAAAGTSSGARESLRKELGAARSERDALREDLKEMDPRALFFGSSSARRDSTRPTGAAPSGEGSSTGDGTGVADSTGPTPAGMDRAAVAISGDGPAGDPGRAGEPAGPRLAPFDAEAT